LVACGAKKIETRSWGTPFRGEIAIHASKGFPKDARAYLDTFVFYGAFRPDHAAMMKDCGVRIVPMACAREVANSLPLGAVIATANLVACWPTKVFCLGDLVSFKEPSKIVTARMNDQERAFGDYTPGRYAWILKDVKPLPEPILAKGALGLWEWKR
jgi:hypothetical protein